MGRSGDGKRNILLGWPYNYFTGPLCANMYSINYFVFFSFSRKLDKKTKLLIALTIEGVHGIRPLVTFDERSNSIWRENLAKDQK